MASFSIPISVAPRKQRTIKLVGRGLKAIFTTKLSGTLVLRKKRKQDVIPALPPLRSAVSAPPMPDHTGLPVKKSTGPFEDGFVDGGDPAALPTVFPDDVHAKLVSRGIKVRDFAYAPTRAGHTNPTVRHPLAFAKDEDAKGIPVSPATAPMPSISQTWEEPHPCLRPLPKAAWGQAKIETHRIPGLFNPALGVAEIEFRLSQNPRTVPIMGLTTRRLLTLSPHLVDLSRYHEMDLEELRRYDRRIVCQLLNGIEPYPWKTVIAPGWAPTETGRAMMRRCGQLLGQWAAFDQQVQSLLLWSQMRHAQEDDAWQDQRMHELRAENHANGLLAQDADFEGMEECDVPRADFEWLSERQLLTIYARRLESAQGRKVFPLMLQEIRMLWAHDGREDDEEITVWDRRAALYKGVLPPFVWGQPQPHDAPAPYWGPNAVWDNYRLDGGTPTGRTLNEYAAELSRCTSSGPWSVEVNRTDALWCSPVLSSNAYLNIVVDELKLKELEEKIARKVGKEVEAGFESESDEDEEGEDSEDAGLKRKRAAEEEEPPSDAKRARLAEPEAPKRGIEEVE